jgi:CDP-diacylglycerol--glycerol-3-phosphate 3-phosphatidyltransferase
MTWNIPNTLTVMRLIAAPLLALTMMFLPRPMADYTAFILFVGASATDWFDGYLARAWNQTSRIGAMLDPIADKAMVTIALLMLVVYSPVAFAIMLPATLILFREVFVSGLREYLGNKASTLQVTALAKWKTTVQMVAISCLLAQGVFEHYVVMNSWGMDGQIIGQIMDGTLKDENGLRYMVWGMKVAGQFGLALMWLAAVLTVMTGWDYFQKARPFLRED